MKRIAPDLMMLIVSKPTCSKWRACRPPARPAKNDDRVKASQRTHWVLYPMYCARSGLSRTAFDIRPNGVRVIAYIATIEMKHHTAIR